LSSAFCQKEADRVAAQATGAALGGEDDRYLGQEGAAGVVEVVVVLVVGEQDGVDAAEAGGGDRRRVGLDELVVAREGHGVLAGRVEGRVGDEPEPAVLDQGGRAAVDADRDLFAGGTGAGHRNLSVG
jgi:hypothetical protein